MLDIGPGDQTQNFLVKFVAVAYWSPTGLQIKMES